MPKIVIIGAGSRFGSCLSIDILSRKPLEDSTIALCDIHRERLEAVTRYVRRAIEANGLPAKLEAGLERKDLLLGADVVITSVSIGGPAYAAYPFKHEIEIPRRYGVDQCVGDTIGPGGVFRFLRTAPVQQEFCKDIERLCPNALMLNYTNPMAMLTWLHSEGSSVANVGLCHSVQNTRRELAKYVGIPVEEATLRVAGINHQAWVLEFRHQGRDAYPLLREAMQKPEIFAQDRVRFEMMKHFGLFVTESSHHNSEYVPYFRRTQELRDQFELKSRVLRVGPPRKRKWMEETGGQAPPATLKRSEEYASAIIEAKVTGTPLEFNGNVMNDRLITNLPAGCCVEVSCTADADGIHPHTVGALPPQCAAINRSNVAVQELAVRAALDHDREAAFHAVALDPLTASVLSLDKIREMFDELWEAEGDLLAYFD